MDNKPTPTIYLIPVPLSDTGTERVLPAYNTDIVTKLKYFIVENVRSARRFLKACDKSINIDELTFSELNGHTDPHTIPSLLQPAHDGHDIGIISEAGCPAIADPGADVVAVAQTYGYNVMPLVGPSSILMGLMGSGFNGQSFAFNGYLPIDGGQRSSKLRELERKIMHEHQTQIFIETPYRNNKLIAELCKLLPAHMRLCVASDITGERQSILTRTLKEWSKAKYDYDKIPTIFLLYK